VADVAMDSVSRHPEKLRKNYIDYWAISAELSRLHNFTVSLKLQLSIHTSSSTDFIIENIPTVANYIHCFREVILSNCNDVTSIPNVASSPGVEI
jgi:hypothetical protein